MKTKMTVVLLIMTLLCSLAASGCAQTETENPPASPEPETANRGVSEQPVYEFETRELYAERDGQRIFGLIHIPRGAGEKMPAVVYSHGLGGSYHYGLQYAEAMAARGYVVYCFDFCGGSPQSRSDGSPYDMSIFTEQEDLEAVLSMIQNLEYVDTDHIFLLGSSQGGLVSAITAADHRDEIAGAVLLYPAFVLVDDAKERFDRPGDVPETYPHLFMTVGRAYFEDLLDYDVYADIADFDKDVLILHGDEDSVVPLSYSERALEVYPSAELKILRGAGHGLSGKDARIAIDFMTQYYHSHIN